jgi:hypothetical protein
MMARPSAAFLRLRSTSRELWQWPQIGWGPSHGPNGGGGDRAIIETERGARQSYQRRPVEVGRVVLAWELKP